MVTIKEDFIEKFGELKWQELQCIAHSNERPPDDETSKVIFRMLEIMDFHCWEFGDSHGLTEEQVRNFLICHKEEVKSMDIPPPSYIGLLGGSFGFLLEEP